MSCPYLKYEDTGWFSWKYICTVTGLEVGNEHNKAKVDNCCNCSAFFSCPIYKSK